MAMRDCTCGSTMHRHGFRKITVRDVDRQCHIVTVEVDVEKFICPTCKSVVSLNGLTLEDGFRVTRRAADYIVETAMEKGIIAAADITGLDKATVSRLVSGRAESVIAQTNFNGLIGLRQIRPSLVEAYGYLDGKVFAYFSGPKDDLLRNAFLQSRQFCVVPDVMLLPHVAQWLKPHQLMISKMVFHSFYKTLMPRIAKRMMKRMPTKTMERDLVERILAKDFVDLNEKERLIYTELNAPGFMGRKYFKLKAQLSALFETHDVKIAALRLQNWLTSCEGIWRDVFQPIIEFIERWSASILKHPLALQSPAPFRFEAPFLPASVLNLQLGYRLGEKTKAKRRYKSEPAFPEKAAFQKL